MILSKVISIYCKNFREDSVQKIAELFDDEAGGYTSLLRKVRICFNLFLVPPTLRRAGRDAAEFPTQASAYAGLPCNRGWCKRPVIRVDFCNKTHETPSIGVRGMKPCTRGDRKG
jgi:hypothetical protein